MMLFFEFAAVDINMRITKIEIIQNKQKITLLIFYYLFYWL